MEVDTKLELFVSVGEKGFSLGMHVTPENPNFEEIFSNIPELWNYAYGHWN